MQTLKMKVPIPDGHEAESFDTKTNELTLRKKQVNYTDFKTDADVFAANGITEEQFYKSCMGFDEDDVASRFIKLLRNAFYGEDWLPQDGDWRYEPRFKGGSSGFRYCGCGHWNSRSGVGSRLAFKTSEHAEYAGTQYLNWYRKLIYPNLKK